MQSSASDYFGSVSNESAFHVARLQIICLFVSCVNYRHFVYLMYNFNTVHFSCVQFSLDGDWGLWGSEFCSFFYICISTASSTIFARSRYLSLLRPCNCFTYERYPQWRSVVFCGPAGGLPVVTFFCSLAAC